MLEVALYPESPDAVEDVKSSLSPKLAGIAEVIEVSERPVAFGVSAVIARLIVDEALGTEPVERVLGEIPKLSSFSVERVTRVL